MKWVQCARCGVRDAWVRDDFDEDEDMEVCSECEEQMESQYRRRIIDEDPL